MTLDTYSDLFDDDLDIVAVRLDEAGSRVLANSTEIKLGQDLMLSITMPAARSHAIEFRCGQMWSSGSAQADERWP